MELPSVGVFVCNMIGVPRKFTEKCPFVHYTKQRVTECSGLIRDISNSFEKNTSFRKVAPLRVSCLTPKGNFVKKIH